ncbi:hypothetical protein RZN22_10325 [Bacillaceae bacterium S4-13-58]
MSNEKTDYKAMQWFGFIIVLLSIKADAYIISPEHGSGPILGLSYFSFTGIAIGAINTFVFRAKERKVK